MLLESVSSTAKRAEELLNSLNDNSVGTDPICIEDHFTGLLNVIQQIYFHFHLFKCSSIVFCSPKLKMH